MKLFRLREIIKEEMNKLSEADGIANLNNSKTQIDTTVVDKGKQDLEKQKLDLDQKKLDFQQQQSDDADREASQRGAESEKKDQEKDDEEGGEETPININFKTQGLYYKDTANGIKNIALSDGDLVNTDEIHFIALAAESAEGRFDKGFENFLRKGKARNVYGKDFSDKDIKQIMKYVKENELVR